MCRTRVAAMAVLVSVVAAVVAAVVTAPPAVRDPSPAVGLPGRTPAVAYLAGGGNRGW
jgi:hypothetical protein